MVTSTPDEELLVRWRAGDKQAGSELVARHAGTLYRFFANKVNDAIEDLSQKTLLACVEARDRIDAGRSFRAYLLGIARHQLFRHFRAMQRDTPEQAWSVATVVGSPSRELARHEQRSLLLLALRHLPLDTQIALELYYWENLTTAEISATLEVSEGTIKSRLSRGRVALREVLDELEVNPELREQAIERLDAWRGTSSDPA